MEIYNKMIGLNVLRHAEALQRVVLSSVNVSVRALNMMPAVDAQNAAPTLHQRFPHHVTELN